MQCLRVVAPGGRLLVVGFASGDIPSIPANIPLVKGFSVVGVRAGAEMARDPRLTGRHLPPPFPFFLLCFNLGGSQSSRPGRVPAVLIHLPSPLSSTAAEMASELERLTGEGHLAPHIHGVYGPDEAGEAFRVLATRKAKGKVVVAFDEAAATATA